MRAGSLDRVIIIQRFTSVVDDYGTPVETWSDIATIRAQLIQASTDEFIRGNGAVDQTVAVFRTWWMDGVTTADRVVFNNQNFNIKETKELGRRNGLDLRCERLS